MKKKLIIAGLCVLSFLLGDLEATNRINDQMNDRRKTIEGFDPSPEEVNEFNEQQEEYLRIMEED